MKNDIRNIFKNYAPMLISAGCAALAVAFAAINHVSVDDIYDFIINNQDWAAAILILLYAFKSVAVFIYYGLLVAAAGFVFELPQALLINSVGTLICITVSYYIGYFTKNDAVMKKLDKYPKIKLYFDRCETNSFLVCYILHAMGLSTEILGMLFGFMKMPYFKYAISSFIAIAPGMVCITVFGREMDFRAPAFWIAAAVEISVIATAYIYSKKRLLKK